MRRRWCRARPASASALAYGSSGARVPTGSISRWLSTDARRPLKGLPRDSDGPQQRVDHVGAELSPRLAPQLVGGLLGA
jgi:hypothetical protein